MQVETRATDQASDDRSGWPISYYALAGGRTIQVTDPCPHCGAWTKTVRCPPLGDCTRQLPFGHKDVDKPGGF